MCSQFAPKRIRVDVVDKRPLAVDLDHREPFPVPGLELLISADVDLLERGAACLDDGPRALAEMAARRVVEDDLGYG
ncbi:MAG TPA: hypothetical protein VIU81_01370 [Gaiellaceae bacterium]